MVNHNKMPACKKFPFVIVIISTLMLLGSSARADEPKIISYVEHVAVTNHYMPIVKAMYQQAGIPARFVLVNNSARSVKVLDDGLFDGDIGKILSSIKNHANITYVPTPISSVGLYLICKKELPCDKSVVDDEHNIIVSRFTRELLTNVLPIKANIAQILSHQKISQMLTGRVNYGLIGDDTDDSAEMFRKNFQVVELSRENYYHILHKRNQALIPALDAALKQVLQQ